VALEWSVLERELEELIRLLMDADIQFVRIAVNVMNARSRIVTAINLIQAHILQNKLATGYLSEFLKLGKRIDPGLLAKRDMLVLGFGSKHTGEWYVLRIRQSRSTPDLDPARQCGIC